MMMMAYNNSNRFKLVIRALAAAAAAAALQLQLPSAVTVSPERTLLALLFVDRIIRYIIAAMLLVAWVFPSIHIKRSKRNHRRPNKAARGPPGTSGTCSAKDKDSSLAASGLEEE